jgi:hypothetical protein
MTLPPPMSPGTLRALGPHVFEATLDQAGDRQGAFGSRDAGVRLSWAELDTYSFREVDSGRLVREEIRIDRDLYRRASETGPYQLLDGVPGDSLILHRTITLWESALGPFSQQASFEEQKESTIEGRPVKVWRVTMAPAPTAAADLPVAPEVAARMLGRTTTVLSLTGSVYVDIETNNRLLAELEGRFVPRADGTGSTVTDEVHVTYRERRILLDVPEDVVPPSKELVHTKKLAPPPFHVAPIRTTPRSRGRG